MATVSQPTCIIRLSGISNLLELISIDIIPLKVYEEHRSISEKLEETTKTVIEKV
ncbi:MAG: hypothetical protein QXE70_10690 [Ignisphaera sp.]